MDKIQDEHTGLCIYLFIHVQSYPPPPPNFLYEKIHVVCTCTLCYASDICVNQNTLFDLIWLHGYGYFYGFCIHYDLIWSIDVVDW